MGSFPPGNARLPIGLRHGLQGKPSVHAAGSRRPGKARVECIQVVRRRPNQRGKGSKVQAIVLLARCLQQDVLNGRVDLLMCVKVAVQVQV